VARHASTSAGPKCKLTVGPASAITTNVDAPTQAAANARARDKSLRMRAGKASRGSANVAYFTVVAGTRPGSSLKVAFTGSITV